MEVIIQFLRDTLDGPLYIVTVVICIILIFACIGYLAERKLKDKKEKEKYATVEEGQGAVTQVADVSTVPNANPTGQVIVQTNEEGVSKETPAMPVQEVGVAKPVSTPPTVVAPPVATPVQEAPVTEVIQEVTPPAQSINPSQAVPEVPLATPMQEVPAIETAQGVATPTPTPGVPKPLENTAVIKVQETNVTPPVVTVPEVVEASPKPPVVRAPQQGTENQVAPTPTVVTPPSPQGTIEPIPQVVVPSVVTPQPAPAPTPAVTQQVPQATTGVVAVPVVKVPTPTIEVK